MASTALRVQIKPSETLPPEPKQCSSSVSFLPWPFPPAILQTEKLGDLLTGCFYPGISHIFLQVRVCSPQMQQGRAVIVIRGGGVVRERGPVWAPWQLLTLITESGGHTEPT